MKNRPELSLALIGISLILCESFYGIPFLGATLILSFGQQPLLFDVLFCLILIIILLVNRQNAIRPTAIIPIFGIVGSFLAIIPFLGILIHWILSFLMILFVPVILSTLTYIPNKNACVIYTQYKDGRREQFLKPF